MKKRHLSLGPLAIFIALSLVIAVGSVGAADDKARSFDEKAVADFYRGRTISIVVGYAPGGGFDITSRLLAKHMGRHIPGNPTVIVANRPGAGSLVAANLVYGTLRRDGTVIANFNSQMLLQQVLGKQGVEFDAGKYNWLGSATVGHGACGVSKDTGITSVKQIMGSKGRVVTMGAEAPGSGITDTAAVMRAALGLKFKLIYGYAGARPVANAVLNGEVNGMCISWEAFTSYLRNFFVPAPKLNMLVIFGSSVPDSPWLKNAVAAQPNARDETGRKLLDIVFAPGKISFPYAVAPGVPSDRVAALRQAYDKTMSDPAFVADFKKTRRALVARSGEEVTKIAKDLTTVKPDVLAALKEALKQQSDPN